MVVIVARAFSSRVYKNISPPTKDIRIKKYRMFWYVGSGEVVGSLRSDAMNNARSTLPLARTSVEVAARLSVDVTRSTVVAVASRNARLCCACVVVCFSCYGGEKGLIVREGKFKSNLSSNTLMASPIECYE